MRMKSKLILALSFRTQRLVRVFVFALTIGTSENIGYL